MLVFQGESAANDLCFTANGTHLLAARDGELVDVWELATGARAPLFGPRVCDAGRVDRMRLQLCPTGWAARSRVFAPVELAHTDGRSELLDLPGQMRVVPSPHDERLIAISTSDEVSAYQCVTFDGKQQWALPRTDTRESPFAFVGPDRFLTTSDAHLHVRSVVNGACETNVPYKSNYLRSFAVSPDLTRFASMGWDRLYLFDATTWAKPTVVTGFSVPILSMAYHPTRPVLATVQGRQTLVKYLDATTGKPLKKFAWKLGSMCAVAFSADGALAAASAEDGRIVVWDADA